jgi:pimeloyl-ACP methyl ester carboxylesterase
MSALRQPIRIATGESVRTAYRQTGSGPLLLLIHGAEADHTMFLGLMEALAKDFSVVAYDQRDSGSTENGSEPYDLETLAGDAARLINFLLEASGRSSVHIYGTSFGGQIAQVLAARHSSLVDRLILGSTWPVDRKLVDVNASAMEQLARLRGQLPGSAEQIAAYFFSQTFLAARPETADMFRGTKRTDAQASRRALLMQAAPPVISFADIEAPVLLLAGGADRLIPPAETFALSRLIAHTHLQELSDLPHAGAVEDPGRVAHAIMDFLLPEWCKT